MVHSRPHSPLGQSQELGAFRHGHLLVVMDGQEDAVLRVEASEGPRQLPPVELTFERVDRAGRVEVQLHKMPSPAYGPRCRTNHDLAEPGPEQLRIAQAVEHLPGIQERVLDSVRRISLVARDQPCGTEGNEKVGLDETLKSPSVAAHGTFDQLHRDLTIRFAFSVHCGVDDGSLHTTKRRESAQRSIFVGAGRGAGAVEGPWRGARGRGRPKLADCTPRAH